MVTSASKLKADGRSRRKVRHGRTEPRIFTPPLRELTSETSLGFAAIEFARDVCGIDLFPWQQWLLVHMLELAGDLTVSTLNRRDPLDPLLRFRKVVVLVARQNGKSVISQVLALFFLFVLGVDLVLGTAQDLDTASEVWDGVQEIIDETPDLAKLADKPIRVNGQKTIRLKTGERYKVKAANRKAGRGLSGDLILLDELREHQSWDAWAAITKTTNARPAALIATFSNAGDMSSVVLKTLRAMAHEALGDPDGINAAEEARQTPTIDEISEMPDLADEDGDDLAPEDFDEDPDTLGIFEWSAAPGCDVMDRDGWAQANPSMGHCISEATIAGDAKTEGQRADTEWTFRTECLCQWPDGGLHGPFPSGAWDRGTVQLVEDAGGAVTVAKQDRISPPWVVSVDMSLDRSHTWLCRAGRRPDGVIQGEVWHAEQGVGWVKPWLVEHASEVSAWTGQARGAQISDLVSQLSDDPDFTIPHVDLDTMRCFGIVHDMVRDGKAMHTPQAQLDVAAATASIAYRGDQGVVDRKKSPGDASPLMAWVEAVWLAQQPVAVPPKVPFARTISGRDPVSSSRSSVMGMHF